MLKSQPKWALSVAKRWKHRGVPSFDQHASLLKKGISLLAGATEELLKSQRKSPRSRSKLIENSLQKPLAEQPFDLHLLSCSSLFRRSRKLYLEQGGGFFPTLVSSPRTLGSPILLEPRIEYSPIEKELIWSATDPIQSKKPEGLLALRTYCSSLFHEQSHRILWKLLPSCPPAHDPAGIRRFLNFAESLVIVLDMALADELGPELASLFYLIGVTYDPGSTVRWELPKPREYRNYLQAALHSTYLNLELYDPGKIPRVIEALFPSLGSFGGAFAERAAVRSGNLDRAFIQGTNLVWQKRNKKVIVEKLFRSDQPVLDLPKDPMDNRPQYLFAERWFEFMGL